MDDSEEYITLYKLSDSSGDMVADIVKEGAAIEKEDLSSDEVFFISTKKRLFVWIGSEASIEKRRNALAEAHDLLKTSDTPFVPIAVYPENHKRFWADLNNHMGSTDGSYSTHT